MHEEVNQPVEVVTLYEKHRARPLYFRWNGRWIKITRINMIHHVCEGDRRIFFFSVSNEAAAYRLRFEPDVLKWHLEEIYVEE